MKKDVFALGVMIARGVVGAGEVVVVVVVVEDGVELCKLDEEGEEENNFAKNPVFLEDGTLCCCEDELGWAVLTRLFFILLVVAVVGCFAEPEGDFLITRLELDVVMVLRVARRVWWDALLLLLFSS